MTKKEMRQAICALFSWFESQHISEEDAVPVMAYAINAIVHTHSDDPKVVKQGVKLVMDMVKES